MKLFKKLLSLTAALAVAAAVIPFSGLVASATHGMISTIALNQEKIIESDGLGSGEVMYFFTPTEDGVYAFYSYNHWFPVSGSLVDVKGGSFVNSIERNNDFYIQYEMKAGEQYILSAKPKWNDEKGSYCLKVIKLSPATEFSLQRTTVVGFVGDTVEINATFGPEWSIIENIQWTPSDDSVVTAESKYAETPDICGAFTFNNVGTATVTATTDSDLIATVDVNVLEAGEIAFGEEKNLSSEDENAGTGMYSFVPKKDGLYAFYSYNNVNNLPIRGVLYDSEMNQLCENGYAKNQDFYVYNELTAGNTYYFKCYFDCENANGSYSVKLDEAVRANSITLYTDTTQVDVGTECDVNISYSPENAIPEKASWYSKDSSIIEIRGRNDTNCNLNFLSAGTATLTATTENGLTDSITFTVSEPDEILLNEVNTVNITSPNGKKRFKFTPNKTELYYFSTDADNVRFEILDPDENSYWGYHGSFIREMTAGVTYYLLTEYEDDCIGTYKFTVSEPSEIVLNEVNTVDITSPNSEKVFTFVPEETAAYSFSTDSENVRFKLSNPDDFSNRHYYESFTHVLTAGVTYCLTAGYDGDYTGKYTFTVTKPTQITSIEIISLPEKLDYYEFEEWFNYYGLKLKITDEAGNVYYWSNRGDYVGGYDVDIHPSRDENGNYQYTDISCGTANAQFTFNIMENPVSSIVITKTPKTEYFYGDVCFGYLSEDGYYLYPDITGIEFTVNYTDGTSVQYGDDAFDKGDLDDIYLNVYVRNNKTVVGKNTVVFSYMNVETTYEVTVKEDTVESISILKAPDNTKCFEYFAPDLTGAEFEITYNDGTTETVAVTGENQGYDSFWSDVAVLIPANASYIIVSLEYDDENNPYYTAAFLSKSCRLDCFTIAESKEIEFIGVDNFNIDLENMTVNVTYKDMTTESFPADVIEFYGNDYFKQIFCRSDKGVFSIICNIQYDQNGYKQGYNVHIFEREIFISDPFGDINGDGVSDVRDLVRLKKILAKLTQDGEDKADLDGDGSIDAVDVAEFRRYLLIKVNVSDNGSNATDEPVAGI